MCDGWLPLYYSPYRQDVYASQIEHRKPGFEICQSVTINVCDDVEEGLLPVKTNLALYIGGMGARDKNFYNDYCKRLGYPDAAKEIQDLFLSGKKAEAAAAVPDQLVDDVALVGSADRIRDRLQAWKAAGEKRQVGSLLAGTGSVEALRLLAEEVL